MKTEWEIREEMYQKLTIVVANKVWTEVNGVMWDKVKDEAWIEVWNKMQNIVNDVARDVLKDNLNDKKLL
jgi:hypothetical protein